ncbi:hypothetical protein PIROE2DRAFT_2537 [Piromyces sp. E2]|nr:hypothetical protein PIROE2DRAFT_2537 [Piromyces sp. E2]|eukprot:OUM69451.1 hypothetical protein PIROE2DRAFT_2537 [Piromyces sp. E2]
MSLSTSSTNDIIINIDKTSISLHNHIEIKNHLNNITIVGSSKEKSIIKFDDISMGFTFYNNVKKIKITNLTIYGYIHFEGVNEIEFENVVFYGTLEANNGKNEYNDNLKLTNIIFYGMTSLKNKKACMDLSVDTEINNSYFYGSSSFTESIIYFNGDDKFFIYITDSYFDGAYSIRCLDLQHVKTCNIKGSTFEKGSCLTGNDGGYINIFNNE